MNRFIDLQKNLVSLFDRQKFQENPHLAEIISNIENRYNSNTKMSDEDIAHISVLGEEIKTINHL